VKPPRLNSNVLQEVLEKGELATGVVITFQVMAVSGVSPGHPNTIRAMPEGGQKELRRNAAGTRHANNSDIWGILKPAYTGQVGGPICAPVAEERRDLRFPVVHAFLLAVQDPQGCPAGPRPFLCFFGARCLQ